MHLRTYNRTTSLQSALGPPGSGPARRTSLLAALAYADLFSSPLTVEELATYQVGTGLDEAEIEDWLSQEVERNGPVKQVGEYYCLRGREATIATRQRRTQLSAHIWRRARTHARWLSRMPYVRMIAVTGSLAMSNISGRPDIDLLVVAEPGRVWICRRWLIAGVRLARLFGDELCPNYIVAADEMEMEQQDFFTAHELAQMVPLYGNDIYNQMLLANSWARSYLPGASAPPDGRRGVSQLQHLATYAGRRRASSVKGIRALVERALRLKAFDRWEGWEMRRLRSKLRPLEVLGAEVVCAPGQCKGHTNMHRESIMSRYRVRLRELGLPDDLV